MRKAINVGVSQQDDVRLLSVAQCTNDVKYISRFLASNKSGFKVCEIINPTSTSLPMQIWDELREMEPNDQLLFYFTGHGRRNSSRKLQLCTKDTNLESLVPTSMSFDSILNLINEIGIKTVLFILDCCYSGAAQGSVLMKGSEDLLVAYEDEILNSKGHVILSSTSPIEVALVSKNKQMSVFTQHFVDICNRKINNTEEDKWITIGDIYTELKISLTEQTPKLFGDNFLFPICKGILKTVIDVKDRNEVYIRIMGHEIGQILPGIEAIRALYFSDPARLKTLSDDKIQSINQDFIVLLNHLHQIVSQSSLVLNDRKIFLTGSKIDLWKLTRKVVGMFDLQLLHQGITIRFTESNIRQFNTPQLIGDAMLIEQLIYNLINNAFNFCYKGTNLQIEIGYDNRLEKVYYLFSVTSYGNAIIENGDIFNLFGKRTKSDISPGLGIGLFISKKIAVALGGSINYSYTKISDFCVPYLVRLMQNNPLKEKTLLGNPKIERYEAGYNKLLPENVIEEIVNTSWLSEKPREINHALIDACNGPTYKVVFTIKIPGIEKEQ